MFIIIQDIHLHIIPMYHRLIHTRLLTHIHTIIATITTNMEIMVVTNILILTMMILVTTQVPLKHLRDLLGL